MTLHQQVQVLIEKQLSLEAIYRDLLSKGHTVKDIENALKDTKKQHLDIQAKGITAIIVFGAVSIGLATISFIASNWDGFGEIGKIIIIITGLISAYMGSWYAYSAQLMKLYIGLLMLAQLIFGAGVLLIGEIISVDIAWQISWLIWAAGVLSAMYYLKSRILQSICILLISIATLGLPSFFQEYDWYRIDYLVYSLVSLGIAFQLMWYMSKKLPQDDFSLYKFD
jgi:uncharacterized membrane protein